MESGLAVFEERVPLTSKDLNRLVEEKLDDILLERIRTQLEGKCTKHGFLVLNTLEILSRSNGYAEVGRFTGNMVFIVKAQGRVLNPADGTTLVGEISKKNKMGMYVIYEDAIRVLLSRDLHLGNEEFETLEIGDKIEIQLKKSRFQVNDPFIMSIGLFIKKIAGGTAAITDISEGKDNVEWNEDGDDKDGDNGDEDNGDEDNGDEDEDEDDNDEEIAADTVADTTL